MRPTNASKFFFRTLSNELSNRYVPDNTFMTFLCTSMTTVNCAAIPFKFVIIKLLIIYFLNIQNINIFEYLKF